VFHNLLQLFFLNIYSLILKIDHFTLWYFPLVTTTIKTTFSFIILLWEAKTVIMLKPLIDICKRIINNHWFNNNNNNNNNNNSIIYLKLLYYNLKKPSMDLLSVLRKKKWRITQTYTSRRDFSLVLRYLRSLLQILEWNCRYKLVVAQISRDEWIPIPFCERIRVIEPLTLPWSEFKASCLKTWDRDLELLLRSVFPLN